METQAARAVLDSVLQTLLLVASASMFADLSVGTDVPISSATTFALGLSVLFQTGFAESADLRSAIATFNLLMLVTYWSVVLLLGHSAVQGKEAPLLFDDIMVHLVVPAEVVRRSVVARDHAASAGAAFLVGFEAAYSLLFLSFGRETYPFIAEMTLFGQILFVVALCSAGGVLHLLLGAVSRCERPPGSEAPSS